MAHPGPIARAFGTDHRRLDALLHTAAAGGSRVDLASFGTFRAAILKHVAMEEKRVIPAATAARGGARLAIAAGLRLDHGAIAALLVPTPTPRVVRLLGSILAAHNRREEEAGGLYELCDAALGDERAEQLVAELKIFPDVRLKPYHDGPEVERHITETLALAASFWHRTESPDGRDLT